MSLGVFFPFLHLGEGQCGDGEVGGGTNYEESGAQTRPVKYVLRVLRA